LQVTVLETPLTVDFLLHRQSAGAVILSCHDGEVLAWAIDRDRGSQGSFNSRRLRHIACTSCWKSVTTARPVSLAIAAPSSPWGSVLTDRQHRMARSARDGSNARHRHRPCGM